MGHWSHEKKPKTNKQTTTTTTTTKMPKTFDGGEPLREQLPVLTNLWILSESVEVFLRHLGKEHMENHWIASSSKEVLNKLTKDDVTNVRLLAMCWSWCAGALSFGNEEDSGEGTQKQKHDRLKKRGTLTHCVLRLSFLLLLNVFFSCFSLTICLRL